MQEPLKLNTYDTKPNRSRSTQPLLKIKTLEVNSHKANKVNVETYRHNSNLNNSKNQTPYKKTS